MSANNVAKRAVQKLIVCELALSGIPQLVMLEEELLFCLTVVVSVESVPGFVTGSVSGFVAGSVPGFVAGSVPGFVAVSVDCCCPLCVVVVVVVVVDCRNSSKRAVAFAPQYLAFTRITSKLLSPNKLPRFS